MNRNYEILADGSRKLTLFDTTYIYPQLPADLLIKSVNALKKDMPWLIKDKTLRERYLKKEDLIQGRDHMTVGMEIRNTLRINDILDEHLPKASYDGGKTFEVQNWDDYYELVLEVLVMASIAVEESKSKKASIFTLFKRNKY